MQGRGGWQGDNSHRNLKKDEEESLNKMSQEQKVGGKPEEDRILCTEGKQDPGGASLLLLQVDDNSRSMKMTYLWKNKSLELFC